MSISECVAKKVDEFNQPSRCKVGALLDYLPTEEADALLFAIHFVRDGKATVAWLTDTLNSNGHSVGKTVVREHVREECACDVSQ